MELYMICFGVKVEAVVLHNMLGSHILMRSLYVAVWMPNVLLVVLLNVRLEWFVRH